MINPLTLAMILSTGAAVTSAGASIGTALWKQKKLEESIEKLSKTVTVDVEDAYIHEIVEQAVHRETAARISSEARIAVDAIKDDMAKKIQKEINKNYSDLKASVKKQMEELVGRIDLDDIRKEIIDEGREEAAKQFKKDLDKIIELQSENLKQVNDIYGNIAESLRGSKGTTLTIS